MHNIVFASIGWLGVVLCTAGYFLLTIGKIKAESVVFQLFNVVGSLCLVATALDTSDLPNAVANLLWMFIGLYALRRWIKTQNATKKAKP